MTSRRQAAYLRRMYARRWAALQRQCDCAGDCETPTCSGLTAGCTCDESPTLREALGLPAVSTTETKVAPEQDSGPVPGIPF